MTTLAAPSGLAGSHRLVRPASVAAFTLGTVVLAARPALVAIAPDPVVLLVAIFVLVLAGGVRLAVPVDDRPAPRAVQVVALVVGLAAFGAGRLLVGGTSPLAPTALILAANTLAAVAEEAWFRRLGFGLLAPGGTAFAVVGSAVLFAAVHVTIYGFWILPLDLAAGLVLGWQRAVTGSWRVSAVTHVVANVLVVW